MFTRVDALDVVANTNRTRAPTDRRHGRVDAARGSLSRARDRSRARRRDRSSAIDRASSSTRVELRRASPRRWSASTASGDRSCVHIAWEYLYYVPCVRYISIRLSAHLSVHTHVRIYISSKHPHYVPCVRYIFIWLSAHLSVHTHAYTHI
ncbi:hypothetical protein BE221DRAFT_65751 [Ostreococcus tauri]|uniref:Uncharacterized protein n=1 Tax=Ostreococcus tauri TaxID=70448 RepID=A0A1Y5II09_OSTTA|nr:hypothetical protein BE221DRAFT_65751 [Ostreococcus tauri]